MHEILEPVIATIEFMRYHKETLLLFIPIILLIPVIVNKFKVIPTRTQSAVEFIYEFLEDQFRSLFQTRKDYRNWMPFFIAVFFYIFINNLMGIIPGVTPHTSNLLFTASLAAMVIIVSIMSGILRRGPLKFIIGLTPNGISVPIRVLMFPIEIVSMLAKPFSLAVRLYANMFAGHTVIMILLSLTEIFHSWLIVPVDIIFVFVMMCFEIIVSFIQAYIFAYLSAIYITDSLYQDAH